MSPLFILSLCFLAVMYAKPNDPYALVPTCGDTGRTCIKTEAKCRNGECVCWNPFGYHWGQANFRCYKQTDHGCEMKNDPTLTVFNRETVDFPFPCRYLVSHVKPKLISKRGNVIGSCEAKIYAFNAKSKGKLYVQGFDVALKITYQNRIEESSLRHCGHAESNNNQVTKNGTIGQWMPFVHDGKDDINYRDSPNGIYVSFDWDHRDNRFAYSVEGCGIKVTHVPFDTVLRLDQRQVPGLSVTVSSVNDPQWLSQDQTVCLAPGVKFSDIELDSFTRSRSMVLRAFTAQVPQILPSGQEAEGECAAIGTTLANNCAEERQKQAVSNCDWMFKEPHFMKCYDDTVGGASLLRLFKSCVQAWCQSTPCAEAINRIRDSGCSAQAKVPQLPNFMAGQMCPSVESNP